MAYFPPTGSTVAFQSDPTKLVGTVSIVGVIPFNNSSVLAKLLNSSVTAYQGVVPWITQTVSSVRVAQSDPTALVGTMSVMGNLSVLGTVPVTQATDPWVVQLTSGSIATTVATGNSSVQVVGLMPPQSVSGVGQFNVNHNGNGSVLTVSLGSIATAPFPASVSGVGIFNVNHTGNGSMFTVWPLASIAGTYAEDTAHGDGNRGLFTLGVRNDAVASFTSANLDYGPIATDSAGRILTKPFAPEESRVQGVSSTVHTASTSLLATSGAGLRNYLTNAMIVNTGSVATQVNFLDGDNSVIGRTIAPGGGGSNVLFPTPMRTNGTAQQIHYTAGTAVSILHVSGYGYTAP